jgi:hypothetical protein
MAAAHAHELSAPGMLAEAHAIIDAARARGIVVRLVGGLAVREHCRDAAFCERPIRDIDLVTTRRSSKAVTTLLAGLGWTENRQVAMASSARKRQFFRPCRHPAGNGRAHDDDRIDLYLDAFQLHHSVDLRDRLELEPYTVSTSDVLLVKLQRTEANDDDVRDMVTVIKDAVAIGEDDAPGVVNRLYLARLCAADWGLCHDVTRNLARCRAALAPRDADDPTPGRARARLDVLQQAIDEQPKRWRWRLRAALGERLAWHEPVDDVEAVYFAPGERP